MAGVFVWNELATSDVDRAKTFYGATLGWSFEDFELDEGPYTIALVDGAPVAGIGGVETGAVDEDEGSYWFSFVEVRDVEAAVEDAVELGASILRPAIDVPGVGRVVVLEDPTGAVIGLMSPA